MGLGGLPGVHHLPPKHVVRLTGRALGNDMGRNVVDTRAETIIS